MAAAFPEELRDGPLTVDTHAHVSMEAFDQDRDRVIARARERGIGFIEIGFDVESSENALALAESLDTACAVGIHPHNAGDYCDLDSAWAEVESLLVSDRVVALGEIGLDYARSFSPRDIQARSFDTGLRLAKERNLAVVIHQRDAGEDTIRMLKASNLNVPIVFHCFMGDADYAARCLDLGGFIGLGGSLTYPRNGFVREAVKSVPRDRILLETDAPYLPPQTYRGKRNEPAYVIETAAVLAGVLGTPVPNVLRMTRENAVNVFGSIILGAAQDGNR